MLTVYNVDLITNMFFLKMKTIRPKSAYMLVKGYKYNFDSLRQAWIVIWKMEVSLKV